MGAYDRVERRQAGLNAMLDLYRESDPVLRAAARRKILGELLLTGEVFAWWERDRMNAGIHVEHLEPVHRAFWTWMGAVLDLVTDGALSAKLAAQERPVSNFAKTVSPGASFTLNTPDVVIPFAPKRIVLVNKDATNDVQISFDGVNVHGTAVHGQAPQVFPFRALQGPVNVWLQRTGGTPACEVQADDIQQ